MRRGGQLFGARIVYETWGELNSDKSNAVLLFTGLSPSAHATSSAADPSPGWWEDMVGPGRPIDTERYFVICANSLGSCFGSTGAASTNPETGERYGLAFPVLTLEDIATATHEVIAALNIPNLYAVCGASMGGMTALSYAILFPDFAQRLVSISSAARSLPLAIALRSLQREAIRKDPAWKNGQYDPAEPPMQGMYMARKIGMITYRSAKEWNKRFARERIPGVTVPGHLGLQFEVESYLEAHAKKFTGGFDANCYLYLSSAMDLYDAAEYAGSLDKAMDCLKIKQGLVIGVETDLLFPLHQQQELAEMLRGPGRDVVFKALPSVQGHDSFLVDMDNFRPVVADFFA